MKITIVLTFLMLAFVSTSRLYSTNIGDTSKNHTAICDSTNSGYSQFFFWREASDSVMFTSINWCDGKEAPLDVRGFEPFFPGFHYSGNLIDADSCTYVLINAKYCSGDTNTHLYLQEVYDTASHYVGLIYGSADYSHSFDTTSIYYTKKHYTSFVFDFSISDSYAGGYTAPEISYVREFTAGDGSYLDEIFDNDRSLLVGIRYYSATNSTTTTRYFKPNN